MAHARYTFVLVHGAWHYGQLWRPVADQLRRASHVVHTPTIAGFGDAPTKPGNGTPALTHADQVASIATYITERDLRDIVLVGHSYGGTIIAAVAQQMPDRIRRLVFQNAIVPRHGHSVLDETPPALRDMMGPPEGSDEMPLPPYRWWREAMINDADSKLAEAAYTKLRSCPMAPALEKLDLQGFYDLIAQGKLACGYVNATEDIAMPPGEWAWHPRFSERLGLYRLVQLSGSHEVMFTAPGRLARKLIEAGRD